MNNKAFWSLAPKEVKNFNNESYFYHRNELLLKLHSIFKLDGLPDYWDEDYILDNLFTNGLMAVVEYNNEPWMLRASVSGDNMYNNPTRVLISVPVFGSFEREIGKDAEIVYFNRINGAFANVEPIISRYAVLLAQCDASINTSLLNSRVAHIFKAETDAEVESLKKMYDDVTQGKPAVFLKKGIHDYEVSNDFINVKNTYIVNDILDSKRQIMNEFLTTIGINNANTDKRERLISDEVKANNGETLSIATLWLQTLQRCFNKVNERFGLNVTIRFNDYLQDTVSAEKEAVENDLE